MQVGTPPFVSMVDPSEGREWIQHVEKATLWAIHHLKPLPMYVFGNVALLGDAVSPLLLRRTLKMIK